MTDTSRTDRADAGVQPAITTGAGPSDGSGQSPFVRLAGLGGVLFVVVVVGVNLAYGITGRPFPHDPIQTVPAYMADYGTLLAIGAAAANVAWLGLAMFAAGLLVATGAARRGRVEGWAVVGVIGVVMQNSIFASVVSADVALLARVLDGAPAEALQDLWTFHNALMAINATSLVIALAGFSLAILRTGIAPRWLGISGLVGAALMLTGSVQVAAAAQGTQVVAPFLVGFVIWMGWIAIVGVRMALLLTPRQDVSRAASSADER